jgi:hypothetical protein
MEWIKQEPGWYTESNIGGICQERNGKWYVYLLNSKEGHIFDDRKGPYKTFSAARKWADKSLLKVKTNG